MSMTKKWVEEEQQKFVEMMFTRDGCPVEDAKNENWESMVESFYEGDEELAWDEFVSGEWK